MTIETLPFKHKPRNSIANNLDKINELVDWANQDTHLYASASGERVTVDDASSVKGLTVDGRSVQDGTPTPDAPVPVQVVEGPLSLVIGGTSVAINLQGNTLASLPNGTHDELHVDSTGHCVLTKNVGVFDLGELSWTYNSNNRTIFFSQALPEMKSMDTPYVLCECYSTSSRVAIDLITAQTYLSDGQISGRYIKDGSNFLYVKDLRYTDAPAMKAAVAGYKTYYPLATPQTIDLGYIDPPAIPSGSVVTVSASLTPEFTLEWWVDDGITALVNDLIAYVDYKTEG